MIYVYAKYQKPTPYIKRDIANVKVFLPRQPDGRNRHYIDSHCIACESTIKLRLSLGLHTIKIETIQFNTDTKETLRYFTSIYFYRMPKLYQNTNSHLLFLCNVL